MNVERLTESDEAAYEQMLLRQPKTLLYASLKYRALLRQHLAAEDCYLVIKEGGSLLGAMPLFLKRSPLYGNVLNSLPFFGSYGGIIIDDDVPDPEVVFRLLVDGLNKLAREADVLCATIISSPFDSQSAWYDRYLAVDYMDSRIGQVAELPNVDVEQALMKLVHRSRRWDVRKARQSGVTWYHTSEAEVLNYLAETHRQNMVAVGGVAKSPAFFQLIPELFTYDEEYRVYVAELAGKLIGALLVFFYNETAEYFTPATSVEHRSLQSNGLLIFEAMKDAAKRGMKYWNFGGTQKWQQGVYDFKRRWGAQDMPYRYRVVCYQDISHLQAMQPSEVLKEFPFFYLFPFGKVSAGDDE